MCTSQNLIQSLSMICRWFIINFLSRILLIIVKTWLYQNVKIMINDLKKWDKNKHFLYNKNHEIFTTQNEVVIVESSTVLPLMALLISILDVITSPQRINRCATFSAIHSSGESSKWKKKIKIFLKTTLYLCRN